MAIGIFGRHVLPARVGVVSDLSQAEDRLRRRLCVRHQTRFQMEQDGFVDCHGFRFDRGGFSESFISDSPRDANERTRHCRRRE